jgi:hypothetical protein
MFVKQMLIKRSAGEENERSRPHQFNSSGPLQAKVGIFPDAIDGRMTHISNI